MSMTTTSGSSTPAMDVFWDNVKTILYALALAMVALARGNVALLRQLLGEVD